MAERLAEKAGAWYTANPGALRAELAEYLAVVEPMDVSPAAGGIVPHAGLTFSGLTAAHVYAWLAKSNADVETILIFGAVHTMYLTTPAIWDSGVWNTPLGDMTVDAELAAALAEAGVGELNKEPHYGDNAIELQMPFLRFCFPKAQVVPIAMPSLPVAVEAGEAAYRVCAASGKKIFAIGSTDLTHYGAQAFGFAPAGIGDKAVEWCHDNDRHLLDTMTALKAQDIVPIAEKDHSACGAGAAAATVAFARAAGCQRGRLLHQTTSYDVLPEGLAEHFVGYGAVIFPLAEA